jgi:putative transposase
LEAEMTGALGAEMASGRLSGSAHRSRYYRRSLVTRVGTLKLRVSQDRHCRFSTDLFERCQRSEKALVAALAEMYVRVGVDAKGQGDHRGTLLPQLLGFSDQRDQPETR